MTLIIGTTKNLVSPTVNCS